jgi:predicted ATPase
MGFVTRCIKRCCTAGITRILGWLAEAYGQARQLDEGFAVLADAFAVVEQNDEHLWEAELYRRKGELMLQSQASPRRVKTSPESEVRSPESPTPSTQSEAEACFLHAIEIARQQQAKLFELRATVSLSRLKQQQGNVAEAHKMLVEVYCWFTEGFDTVDLRDAKVLLDSLGSSA